MRFAKTFWALFASLSVIAGLYWGAASVGQIAGFWIVLSVAVLGTGVLVGFQGARSSVRRIRDYPVLLARLEAAREEREAAAAASFAAGVASGLEAAKGALYALFCEPPTIVGVSTHNGEPMLVGKIDREDWVYGARFVVRSPDAVMGVVQVVTILAGGRCHLKCVEDPSTGFWDGVARRAEEGLGPPDNVALRHYWPLDGFSYPVRDWILDAKDRLGTLPSTKIARLPPW